jgi:hypothetical protein
MEPVSDGTAWSRLRDLAVVFILLPTLDIR